MTVKKNLLAKVDETNEQISRSPIIKGLMDGGLSLIPFLGSAISSSLDARASQLFEENSRKFIEEVHQIINGINESKLDKNFLETPEFTSLLIETLTHNARVHEGEKVKFFAKIFTGFTTIQGSQTPYKEGFIRIIDELSIEHIRIFTFILDRVNNPIETDERLKDRVQSKQISVALNIADDLAYAYCEQMIRYGLLRDWTIGRYDYQPGSYTITGYGFEFAKFLRSSFT